MLYLREPFLGKPEPGVEIGETGCPVPWQHCVSPQSFAPSRAGGDLPCSSRVLWVKELGAGTRPLCPPVCPSPSGALQSVTLVWLPQRHARDPTCGHLCLWASGSPARVLRAGLSRRVCVRERVEGTPEGKLSVTSRVSLAHSWHRHYV